MKVLDIPQSEARISFEKADTNDDLQITCDEFKNAKLLFDGIPSC